MLRHHLDGHARPSISCEWPTEGRFVSMGTEFVVCSDCSAIFDARLTGWDQPRISRRGGAKRCPTVVRTPRLAPQPTLMKVVLQGPQGTEQCAVSP